MVAKNIIHILKTLADEGYITIHSDMESIVSILEEYDLQAITEEDFSTDSNY